MELLLRPETYVSLLTLTSLEIVLGIDNIIFISILVGRVPKERREVIRRTGLALALFSRLGLLFSISWVMSLESELFAIVGNSISGKDLILIGGGLFLLGKATHEIYENVERPAEHQATSMDQPGELKLKEGVKINSAAILVQIILLDIVFSLDSVITAVGMVKQISIMVAAMVIAVGVMMWGAKPIGDFVQRHASIRVLALAFLVLIGVLLMAEGFDQHISKAYIYFAMAFSLFVELVNMRLRSRKARLEESLNESDA